MNFDRDSHDLDSHGPLRFIRNWLSFNEARPARKRLLWMFVATVLSLLLASALLAVFGRHA